MTEVNLGLPKKFFVLSEDRISAPVASEGGSARVHAQMANGDSGIATRVNLLERDMGFAFVALTACAGKK